MTRGCHSSRGAILLSSLDAMLESQKTGAGGLLSLRGLGEGGLDGVRGRERGGIPPPYGIAENNEHIITQRPKHLL